MITSRRKIGFIIFIILIALAIPFTIFLSRQRQEVRQRASEGVNLVQNGNFSQGETGWTFSDKGKHKVENNTLVSESIEQTPSDVITIATQNLALPANSLYKFTATVFNKGQGASQVCITGKNSLTQKCLDFVSADSGTKETTFMSYPEADQYILILYKTPPSLETTFANLNIQPAASTPTPTGSSSTNKKLNRLNSTGSQNSPRPITR